MWSLAVEEQYYLVWPLLLGVLLLATRSRWIRHRRRALVLSVLSLAALSAVWMGVAAHIYSANRAYLGTDTRAWELLLGGTAAMLWPPGRAGITGSHLVGAHRAGRGRGSRRSVVVRRPTGVGVGRRPGRLRRMRRAGNRRRRAGSRRPLRQTPRPGPGALGGVDLLQPLSLALADDRADDAGQHRAVGSRCYWWPDWPPCSPPPASASI